MSKQILKDLQNASNTVKLNNNVTVYNFKA